MNPKGAEANVEEPDEIHRVCMNCENDYTVAYWDEELEYYIYLSEAEESVCSKCH